MVKNFKFFYSKNLNNRRTIEVYLPSSYEYDLSTYYNVLYVNDGQDMVSLNLEQTLEKLYTSGRIVPLIAVAIFATNDRTKEYGIANFPNAQGLGAKAATYTHFLIDEVMPFINSNFRVLKGAKHTGILGASLGGLSAFSMAWNFPDLFSKVGVFSGSFWWRTDDTNVSTKQNSRIMHNIVRHSNRLPHLKMWFEVGTADETNDRDGNGVIDAIQDTTELMDELRIKGYKDKVDMDYIQVEGGQHNQQTWAKVLPDFLIFAFPPRS